MKHEHQKQLVTDWHKVGAGYQALSVMCWCGYTWAWDGVMRAWVPLEVPQPPTPIRKVQ